jgi:hypothetical protein
VPVNYYPYQTGTVAPWLSANGVRFTDQSGKALGLKRWAFPLVVVGMNSIFIYSLGQIGIKAWLDRGLRSFTRDFSFLGDLGTMPQHIVALPAQDLSQDLTRSIPSAHKPTPSSDNTDGSGVAATAPWMTPAAGSNEPIEVVAPVLKSRLAIPFVRSLNT